MLDKSIIVFTKIFDPTADVVILQLQKEKKEPIRLNTEEIPLDSSFDFNLDTLKWEGNININTSKRSINVNEVRSIWWRRPSHLQFPVNFSENEKRFAKSEMFSVLGGFWRILDCYWMSFPTSIRNAEYKIEQLQRASQMGFEVPRTLVTMKPDRVREFAACLEDQMIFKVFSDPFLCQTFDKHENGLQETSFQPLVTKTTLITEKELAQLHPEKLIPPCLFQEYIPKRVELRVTVIGDEVFVAEIDSQAREETRIDWRDYSVDITYRKATLPLEIEERCLKFVRSYNLNYSAIDLILTPDGRYVFLENNPNGQFVFVQQAVPELHMVEALCACLIRGANS